MTRGETLKGGDTILERELRESRQREADYRERLERHRELSSKLRSHAAQLREALKAAAPGPPDMSQLLVNVARLSSQALGIPRASIWLFDSSREQLVCRFQLVGGQEVPSGGLRIAAANCPAYIAALSSKDAGALAFSDASRDTRVNELESYLREHAIGAMLDIPIAGPGVLHGVVCHEFQGGPRVWLEEEVDFATMVGAMVALALEAERRVSAEHQARGTQARYQQLVESLPVTVYSFEVKTAQLAYLSPKIRELGAWIPEELLARGGIARWVEAICAEDRAPVLQRLSGSVVEGLAPELEYRISLAGGARRWIRDSCSVVRDPLGTAIAIQGTLADITALKEAQLERAEVERRYRTLLENVDLPALILGPTGRVEFVNDSLVKLTGFSREETLGADGFALLVPDADSRRLRGDFLRSLQKRTILPRFESSIRTRAGAERRILWTNTLLRSTADEVVGTASLGIDITERIESEAAQLEAHKLESLGRLAASVAHDFNNLLMVMAHSSQTLGSASDADEAEARGALDTAIEQAASLTKSLLAYARREAIAPALVAIDSVVESTLPLLRQLVAPPLVFSHHLDAARARVVIDPSQFRQVLLNLVANAVDATRGSGRQVRLSTHLVVLELDQAQVQGLVAAGTFYSLSVADDGRGIPLELQARVFEPFFTTKARGDGTGLGLAMCASIVRRAGGFMSVASTPGQGSTFRVCLPVAKTVTATPEPASAGEMPVIATEAPTVLVVEDNEAIRNMVAKLLSSEGLHVLEAADLTTARKLFKRQRIDLLLTDAHLPDGSGAAFAAELGPDTKVLLMSGDGYATPRLPVDAVLTKPFQLDELSRTSWQLLGRRPPLS